jgi:hypothetical protein
VFVERGSKERKIKEQQNALNKIEHDFIQSVSPHVHMEWTAFRNRAVWAFRVSHCDMRNYHC